MPKDDCPNAEAGVEGPATVRAGAEAVPVVFSAGLENIPKVGCCEPNALKPEEIAEGCVEVDGMFVLGVENEPNIRFVAPDALPACESLSPRERSPKLEGAGSAVIESAADSPADMSSSGTVCVVWEEGVVNPKLVELNLFVVFENAPKAPDTVVDELPNTFGEELCPKLDEPKADDPKVFPGAECENEGPPVTIGVRGLSFIAESDGMREIALATLSIEAEGGASMTGACNPVDAEAIRGDMPGYNPPCELIICQA